MNYTPTYVIGVGGAGIEVIERLEERASNRPGDEGQIRLLAVDSDHGALERLSDVPTIPLESDSGVVGEAVESYPYLASDITVPTDGANRLRHVGRYKMDNPAPPTFQRHQVSLAHRLEQFLDQCRTSLSCHPRSFTIVLVGSLAGGTGSGILPLYAALLNHVIQRTVHEDEETVRLVGVGIVPPLEFDPEHDFPPAEPVSYLNTYAALRNLFDLFDAEKSRPVEVPVYSAGHDGGGVNLNEGGGPGKVFRVEDSPFDIFWLASLGTGGIYGRTNRDSDVTEIVADLLVALSEADKREIWARPSEGSPLGTIGYATVRPPHQMLRNYCDLKSEREEARTRLEKFVEPKLDELREKRGKFQDTLETRSHNVPSPADRLDRIYGHLTTSPQSDREFVLETDPEELASAFESLATQTDVRTYYSCALTLEGTLTEGGVVDDIRADIEQTVTEIRDRHEFDLVSEHRSSSMALPDLVNAVVTTLEERREKCEDALADTPLDVRDVVPPTNDLFTSDRERLEQRLETIEDDLGTLSDIRTRLEAVDEMVNSGEEILREARVNLREELDTCERDISHFVSEKERIENELDTLDRDIASLRQSLASAESHGHEFVLPLAWDALADVTIDEVEEELTSLRAYRDRGLLAVDVDELAETLADACNISREWPDSIGQHESAVATTAEQDRTFVLYHESNEPLVEGLETRLTHPGTVRFSSEEDIGFTDRPFQIEMVSISNGGNPESLRGFQQLESMRERGLLRAMAGSYRDYRRALAYPEWYGTDVADAFESK